VWVLRYVAELRDSGARDRVPNLTSGFVSHSKAYFLIAVVTKKKATSGLAIAIAKR